MFDGNVFDSDADVIAHQVNLEGVMGSGIAKTIKEQFPEVWSDYWHYCQQGEQKLGDMVLVRTHKGVQIANMFTQDRGLGPTERRTDISAIETAFKLLLMVIGKNEIVAIPYNYGCGSANGDWDTVLKTLTKVFDKAGRTLEIWKL
jgi:O-acetyl-ADP-ribose deacetylase (regulator of RNase III)